MAAGLVICAIVLAICTVIVLVTMRQDLRAAEKREREIDAAIIAAVDRNERKDNVQ